MGMEGWERGVDRRQLEEGERGEMVRRRVAGKRWIGEKIGGSRLMRGGGWKEWMG
jgi:hypothetical protein